MSNPRAKVEKIALYLGKPWKFNCLCEPSSYHFEIIDGLGRALFFRVDGQKFKVSGHFPKGRTSPWREDYKTVGVSIARPAKDIAADVLRRLIPHYLEAYEKAVERYKVKQEGENHLSLIAQSIIKVTGGRLANDSRASRSVYFDNGEAKIWSSEEITLTLRKLSVEQAIQLVSLLR